MGRFQIGQEKVRGSGRRKGTPNRRTECLDELIAATGESVPERLLLLLPQLSLDRQADVLLDLMAYLYPKRKAVELSASSKESLLPRVVVTLPSNGREVR